jgi:hypothetical protein
MSHSRPTASEFISSIYDPQLEREFFARVMLPNGTAKFTSEHRLDDLNHLSLPMIKALPFKPLRIMDVAASSGVSSAEWHDQLLSAGLDFTLCATDLVTTALHAKALGAECLFDGQMKPIHVSAFGRGMPPKAPMPIGIVPMAVSTCLKLVRNRPVSLMSKRFQESPRLRIEQDDIQKRSCLTGFHVLRAANILHRKYFTERQLIDIIQKLKSRLAEGGLFIVCRTLDGCSHGVMCSFNSGTLLVVARIGNGHEVEPLLHYA